MISRLRRTTALALGLAIGLTGCMVGPDYRRPDVAAPSSFRGAQASLGREGVALSELAQARVFADPKLQAAIESCLAQNLDLAAAANRVLQAQARFRITRSALFPAVGAGVKGAGARLVPLGGNEAGNASQVSTGLGLSWELDLWGKLRRGNEAAKARILGAVWGRRAVATSLVGQLATLYYETSAIEQQLEITRRTLAAREESLRLTRVREASGAGSLVDVRQAEQLVYGASTQLANLNRLLTQHENAMSVLMGRNPDAVAHAPELPNHEPQFEIPTGLPSSLLEKRPDIQQAEQELAEKTSAIGVAKAAYFPQIALTAEGGIASASLATLVSSPALVWSLAGALTQPLFNAGRLIAQVDLAELERDEALLKYRKAVQQSFREVSDGLVAYQRGGELRDAQRELLASAREARRLSDLRYQGGTTSYLEVLDSETRLFTAELALVQAELSVLLAFVEVYRALGGGWSNAEAQVARNQGGQLGS
jgi:multidrug efflux system outer membrane protein